MKSQYWLIFYFFALNLSRAQSPATTASYEHFTHPINRREDTTRIARLIRFQERQTTLHQFKEAKLALLQALRLAQQLHDSSRIARVYKTMGQLANKQNNYPQALLHYQQALSYLKGASHSDRIHQLYAYIGNAYQHTLDVNHAKFYYTKIIDARAPRASLFNQSQAYGGLANLADQRNDAQQALNYNQKAQAILRQLGRWDDYYNKLVNIAFNYSDLNRPQLSVHLYKQCMQYVKSIKKQNRTDPSFERHFITAIYDGIPYPLIKLKRFKQAEHFAKLALVYGRQDNGYQTLHQMWVYDALTILYEKQGKYRQALVAHKQWAIYRDTIQNQARSQKFAELETRYQTNEKEAQIRRLDAVNAHQVRQLWAGMGGLLVLAGLLSVMVWQYQRIQRSRTKIQQQSDELGVMMKELHHRVKNNLAIVHGLLNLQLVRLKDPAAKQAMLASQQRVNAMSLIHQRLYLTDRITRVNMHQYLVDLTQSLLLAYGYDSPPFNLTLAIEQQELEADTAIPLGLIANEVITNALKYAYINNQCPQLRVALFTTHELTLEIEDNGPGIDQASWQPSTDRSSFGKQLIQLLSDQLQGQYEVRNDPGTIFRLVIPLK
ncbi:sensor histidine kinase [Spirosoma flavum]|uniref:histidine kinase n=1 Tax=Spirosoma flavum TaxID=2048557 RepID=A0ABW6ATF1_9BACT